MEVDKKKCIKLVIEQIENMLYNNKDNKEDIAESFINWCEGGVVFYMHRDIELKEKIKINEKEEKLCNEYMREIAPLVDNMTNKLYEMYEEKD